MSDYVELENRETVIVRRQTLKSYANFSRVHNQEQPPCLKAEAQAAGGQRAGALHLLPREHDGVISPGKKAARPIGQMKSLLCS